MPHKDLVGCTRMSLNSHRKPGPAGGPGATPCQSGLPRTRWSPGRAASPRRTTQAEWATTDDRLVAVAANNRRFPGPGRARAGHLPSGPTPGPSLTSPGTHLTPDTGHQRSRHLLSTCGTEGPQETPSSPCPLVARGRQDPVEQGESGKYLASAHEGEVKLWDMRNTSSPCSLQRPPFPDIRHRLEP